MSTYTAVEAALLTLVRAYSSGTVYTATNSSVDNWRVLDGGAARAVVIEMAEATTESDTANGRNAFGTYQEVHRLGVWVCVARGSGDGGDVAAKVALKTATEALKDYLRPYERLNAAANVSRAQIARTTAPAYISPSSDATRATHVAQQVIVQVQCRAVLSPLEVAGA